MKSIERLLWWLFAGTAGGLNRGRIIEDLLKMPQNANGLAENLALDYKTITHHLKILEKNRLITSTGGGYGRMYFPSQLLDENMDYFDEIWGKIGKNKIKKNQDKEGKHG
jgi:predicted transcriptional regulator